MTLETSGAFTTADAAEPGPYRPGSETIAGMPRAEVERIMTRHARHEQSVDALEFKSARPRRIVLNFSAMNPDSFDRWSWHWPDHVAGSETTFVFLCDSTFRYYLGCDEEPVAIRTRRYIERLLAEARLAPFDVVSVGSSMGGYAAVYYAFWLGFRGTVAVNPQVNLACAQMHSYNLWERKIRSTGTRWVDLDRLIFRFSHRPRVFLLNGRYPADEFAADALAHALQRRRCPFIREFDDHDGHDFRGFDKPRLNAVLDYLFGYEVATVPDSAS